VSFESQFLFPSSLRRTLGRDIFFRHGPSSFAVGSERGRTLLAPPCPAYQIARLKPAQLAAMMRFSSGDFYADIAAYGRKDFVCEVYTDGETPRSSSGRPTIWKRRSGWLGAIWKTVKNTELLWAAQGRKGPAVAKSEELLREAFETLSQSSGGNGAMKVITPEGGPAARFPVPLSRNAPSHPKPS